MRHSIIGLTVALIAMGTHAAYAGGSQCSTPCGSSGKASAAGSCSPARATSSVAIENPGGKIAGNFDAAMSGVCRFSCATKLKYKSKDVIAQPGAVAGRLTQCPVSGVVFKVDASRPRVRVSRDEYVTCCDKCAHKLKANPRRYLKA
jgi:hypothetical protein